jgi:hypothetical protein
MMSVSPGTTGRIAVTEPPRPPGALPRPCAPNAETLTAVTLDGTTNVSDAPVYANVRDREPGDCAWSGVGATIDVTTGRSAAVRPLRKRTRREIGRRGLDEPSPASSRCFC